MANIRYRSASAAHVIEFFVSVKNAAIAASCIGAALLLSVTGLRWTPLTQLIASDVPGPVVTAAITSDIVREQDAYRPCFVYIYEVQAHGSLDRIDLSIQIPTNISSSAFPGRDSHVSSSGFPRENLVNLPKTDLGVDDDCIVSSRGSVEDRRIHHKRTSEGSITIVSVKTPVRFEALGFIAASRLIHTFKDTQVRAHGSYTYTMFGHAVTKPLNFRLTPGTVRPETPWPGRPIGPPMIPDGGS